MIAVVIQRCAGDAKTTWDEPRCGLQVSGPAPCRRSALRAISPRSCIAEHGVVCWRRFGSGPLQEREWCKRRRDKRACPPHRDRESTTSFLFLVPRDPSSIVAGGSWMQASRRVTGGVQHRRSLHDDGARHEPQLWWWRRQRGRAAERRSEVQHGSRKTQSCTVPYRRMIEDRRTGRSYTDRMAGADRYQTRPECLFIHHG
nr:hypothetical protein CFP56_00533 [Quercus suber]